MKPQRKIGKSRSSLRAQSMSTKNGRQINLESALEKDFCYLLEFDSTISTYVEQPVTIEYEFNGSTKRYTPDFLIRYRDEKKPHTLVEVKYRNDIRENWQKLKPKFKAAKEYAKKKGWEFKIYTEAEIQNTHYLDNIKFLLPYRQDDNLPDEAHRDLLLRIIEAVTVSTPEEIILIAFRDEDRRAELIPTLWRMVGSGLLGCNLFNKLTMKSKIWCVTD